jgi:hypothetical protein
MKELGMKASVDTVSAVVVVASIASSFVLLLLRPPVGLAAPTSICQTELVVISFLFLLSVALTRPAKGLLNKHIPSVSRFFERRVVLPTAARAVAFLVILTGSLIFAFWSVADVLGGYNGYGYSFSSYPLLRFIYKVVGLQYLRAWDVGGEASFFFLLAILGLILLRANRSIGRALKDSITLFAAPSLIIFELALWYFAPADMSWHVTDFLWIGGVADGGWRVTGGGGAYLVSNWLVLFVSLLLVASRIPWLSIPSRIH